MSDLGWKPWYKEMSSWEEADGGAQSQAAPPMRKEEAEGQTSPRARWQPAWMRPPPFSTEVKWSGFMSLVPSREGSGLHCAPSPAAGRRGYEAAGAVRCTGGEDGGAARRGTGPRAVIPMGARVP